MKQSESPRDLQETDEFKSKREELFPDAKLFDDITFAITFTIAKSPATFPVIPDTDVQVAKVRATPKTPAVSIFFRQKDDKLIELLDMLVEQG